MIGLELKTASDNLLESRMTLMIIEEHSIVLINNSNKCVNIISLEW